MSSPYERVREPQPLDAANIEFVGDFLVKNFRADLEYPSFPSLELLRTQLRRSIYDQFPEDKKMMFFDNKPKQLFRDMKAAELAYYMTHLYMMIQSNALLPQMYDDSEVLEYSDAVKGSRLLQKVLNQKNPYVLRLHVFNLHNRMYALINSRGEGKEDWVSRFESTYQATQECLKLVQGLDPKFARFKHFLEGYLYYTLAMDTEHKDSDMHWEEAYKELLHVQDDSKDDEKAMFMVTLGQGLFVFKEMEEEYDFEAVLDSVADYLDYGRAEILENEILHRKRHAI